MTSRFNAFAELNCLGFSGTRVSEGARCSLRAVAYVDGDDWVASIDVCGVSFHVRSNCELSSLGKKVFESIDGSFYGFSVTATHEDDNREMVLSV